MVFSDLQSGSNQPLVSNSEVALSSGSGYSWSSLMMVSIVGGIIGVMISMLVVLTRRSMRSRSTNVYDEADDVTEEDSDDTGIHSQSETSNLKEEELTPLEL